MNITLSAPPGRHRHPPEPATIPEDGAAWVRPIDRLALRLGVALVDWSTRPRRARPPRRAEPTRQSLALYREQRLARAEREREAERRLWFTVSQWRA